MTIRNIFILSRLEAERFDPASVAVIPCGMISITEPHEVPPKFNLTASKYEFILRYIFHDITANSAWDMGGDIYKAMTLDQAYDLVALLKAYEESISTLVVHCAAGISRSSAVALAIAEWKGLSHIVQEIHTSMRYFPNGHVLRMMRLALGTHKEGDKRKELEEMYSKLFESRFVPWSVEEK